VSGWLSIPLPYRTAHALVRYSDLIEFRAFGPKTKPLVEPRGRRLCVQVHLAETTLCSDLEEATHQCYAGAGAAVPRQYCDATNLTGGFEAGRANCVTFCRRRVDMREHMDRNRINLVKLLALRNALLLDENFTAYGRNIREVVRP